MVDTNASVVHNRTIQNRTIQQTNASKSEHAKTKLKQAKTSLVLKLNMMQFSGIVFYF